MKVMLSKEIRNYLFIIYCLLFTSCSNSDKAKQYKDIDYALKSNDYVNKNFATYSEEMRVLNDSINIYIDSLLATFTGEYISEWQIDSMLCINSKNDKLIAAINVSIGACNDCWSDDVIKVLGKKINGKWFFFKGGESLTVPRNMYGKDPMHPLTFYELSEIARKELLQSSLIKNNRGEYVINDKWIDDHFYQNGFGVYNNRASYDSIHWMLIIRKWKEKIDTNEYKPLRRNKMKPAL